MSRKSLFALLIAYGLPLAASAEPLVYVAAGSANEVVVIDAATNAVVKSFPGIENPHGIVAIPDGEYLVAGSLHETRAENPKPDEPNSRLAVIHPEHGHVMAAIPVVGMSHHQAISPDGRYVFSTHSTRGYVSVLDMQQNRIAQTIHTGPGPNYTAVTRDGKTAFVSNSGNNTISEVDLTTWSVRRTLPGGPAPEHMAFSPDERTIYVVNPRAGTVSAVSRASAELIRTFAVGALLHGLDISDDGATLFVSSRKDNKLVALDPTTGAMKTLVLAPSPYHLNTIAGTGKVYVSSSSQPTIWVVDQKTLALLATITIRGEGHQMAVIRKP